MAEVGSLPDLPAELAAELHEMKMRIEEILTALNEESAGKVGFPWKVDPTTGDLYPEPVNGVTPGIGTKDNVVSHVGVGEAGDLGLEGFITYRDPSVSAGGLLLVSMRDQDPVQNPTPNAPMRIASTGLVVDSQVWVETSIELTDEYQIITGAGVQDSETGKWYAPLVLGPKVVRQDSQENTSSTDYDVTDTTQVVVSMTMTKTLAPNSTSVGYEIRIAELGGQDVRFTIELRVNSIVQAALTRVLTLNAEPGITISQQGPYALGLVPTDVVDVRVTGVSSHPQSDGWVLGSDDPSRVVAYQG